MDKPAGLATVYVESTDARLRRALVARLRRMPDVLVADERFGPGEHDGARAAAIVVATSADIDEGRCRMLREAGAQVIILTPVVRKQACRSYRLAGAAAYLAMDINSLELQEAIERAALAEAKAHDGPETGRPGDSAGKLV